MLYVNEILASETILGNKYMRDKVSMVNIHFEDEELSLVKKLEEAIKSRKKFVVMLNKGENRMLEMGYYECNF